MDCLSCGAANPEAKRFCGDCGAALPLHCPALSTSAAQGLGGDAAPASPPPAAELSEGERRQVTVLFADLSGYTRLSREIDAEELHALAGRFFDAVDAVVEGYGGTVRKHIGDCIMAVFGAPFAHSNDSERAARAALDIQRRVPALADARGRPLGVHIGIASGQVVASGTGSARHREYTVTGESVNLASRLTDAAQAGEILISDAVHLALAERLACVEARALAVKGFTEPVRAWRLLGLRETAEPGHRPFVGRRSELQRFRALLAACSEVGHGQAVYVRGEAGIGKTRLIEEFQAAARRAGFVCHTGLVLDFGAGTGQDAIRSLVRSLLGLKPGGLSDRAAVQAAAEWAVADGLVAAERRVYLNDLLDLPQPVELRALYDAMDSATRARGTRETVAELVARASAERPLLLVIEDVHWADRPTLDHLAMLTETAAAAPGGAGDDLARRGRPTRRRLALAHRPQPARNHRPRAATAAGGGNPGRRVLHGPRRAGPALRRARGGQPFVPRAAPAPCRGECRVRACRARCRAWCRPAWTGSTRPTSWRCKRRRFSASGSIGICWARS